MTYGLQLFNASGTKFFDSNTALGGCIVDIVTTDEFVTQTKTYPEFPGRSAYVVLLYSGDTEPVIDTTLGYPRIVFPISHYAAYPSVWMVFVL
jgi:hypothetical protein